MLLSQIVKEIFTEAINTYIDTSPIRVVNYWMSKEGELKKVNNHLSYARLISGLLGEDESYEWMFNHGWARLIIENDVLWISRSNSDRYNNVKEQLTKSQRDTLIELMMMYPRPLTLKDGHGDEIAL